MRGLLWFLSAVLLLGSTDGGKTWVRMIYEEQHENKREILDKAIIKANEDYGNKHIDFYSILSEDNSKRMIHVLLTSTTCDKTTSGHREDCEVSEQNKPWVSCVACGHEMNCARLKEREKIQNNLIKCTAGVSSFHIGGQHPMFQKESRGNDEQGYGCLGCI